MDCKSVLHCRTLLQGCNEYRQPRTTQMKAQPSGKAVESCCKVWVRSPNTTSVCLCFAFEIKVEKVNKYIG